MFFYLNSHTDLLSEIKPGLHLDAGWSHLQLNHISLYYKGYLNQGNLADEVVNIYYGARPEGIWTVIEDRSDHHGIYTPEYRPYPLYEKEHVLTNIPQDNWLHVIPNTVLREPNAENISLEQAAEQILEILRQNISNILATAHEPTVIFSGGIDSLALLAITDSLTQDYYIKTHEPDLDKLEPIHREQGFEEFYKLFHNVNREYSNPLIELLSKKFWGYKFLSTSHSTANFITGFWGDELMFRNPDHINLFARLQGTTAVDLAKETDYMHHYLNRSSYSASKDIEVVDESQVHSIIKNMLTNDFQMWHLDNHTYYSPYFDSRIYDVMRRLSVNDILQHGLTACIQTAIIKLVNPTFLLLLAAKKNTEFDFENYKKNKHVVKNLSQKLRD